MSIVAGHVTATAEVLLKGAEMLGAVAAGVTIGLGVFGMAKEGVGWHSAQKELAATYLLIEGMKKELASDTSINPTERVIKEMEIARLQNRTLELQHKRKFCRLGFLSSGVLTAVGAIALVAALGIVTGPAGVALSFVSLGLTGLTIAIAIGMWYSKRKGKKELEFRRNKVSTVDYEQLMTALKSPKSISQMRDDTIVALMPDRMLKVDAARKELCSKYQVGPIDWMRLKRSYAIYRTGHMAPAHLEQLSAEWAPKNVRAFFDALVEAEATQGREAINAFKANPDPFLDEHFKSLKKAA
ncbi:MAG: hypothetical protein KDK78_08945 [Chlamydiia bacterium]|nr:hypothetical protein [Chlamydiia bacterium]